MSIQRFEPIAVTGESTVVAQFEAVARKATSYQSEAELEQAFIDLLKDQAYTYLPIVSEASLIQNLRAEISRLNKVDFTDTEWERFFREEIASDNEGIVEKTRKLRQGGHIRNLKRDDGSVKNVTLIDKNNIHNNSLQVINQYEVDQGDGGAKRSNRYDVTVLVNAGNITISQDVMSSAAAGFTGGLNWYRNIDRNQELLAPFDGLQITVPALYIAGERDLGAEQRRAGRRDRRLADHVLDGDLPAAARGLPPPAPAVVEAAGPAARGHQLDAGRAARAAGDRRSLRRSRALRRAPGPGLPAPAARDQPGRRRGGDRRRAPG